MNRESIYSFGSQEVERLTPPDLRTFYLTHENGTIADLYDCYAITDETPSVEGFKEYVLRITERDNKEGER